jgi:hypothetical protein
MEIQYERALITFQHMMNGCVICNTKSGEVFFMNEGNLYLLYRIDFCSCGKDNKVCHKKDYPLSYFIQKFGEVD